MRYDASIAAFPLRLKRSVWRRGVRATYSVWLANNPFAVAQDRNSLIASETRDRLAWTAPSRQSICAAAPALQRSGIKPPDPDEDVRGAHKAFDGKRRLSRPGDTIGQLNLILPAHSTVGLAVARAANSSAQRRYMLEILTALLCAPSVAGLVLGGDKLVGAAASFGREVEVARRAPDALLDMAPSILDCLQAPLLLIRRNQERAERTAVGAFAFERVGSGPVPRRLQRQSNSPAQMVERRLPEPGRRRPRLALRQLGERKSGGRQHVVWPVCPRPSQQALDRTRGEPLIDPARGRQKIDDEVRPHRLWPRPRVDLLLLGRVARHGVYQSGADPPEVAYGAHRRRNGAQQQIAAGAEMSRGVTSDNPDQQLRCARGREKGGGPHDRSVVGRGVIAFGGQLGEKLIDALHIP